MNALTGVCMLAQVHKHESSVGPEVQGKTLRGMQGCALLRGGLPESRMAGAPRGVHGAAAQHARGPGFGLQFGLESLVSLLLSSCVCTCTCIDLELV